MCIGTGLLKVQLLARSSSRLELKVVISNFLYNFILIFSVIRMQEEMYKCWCTCVDNWYEEISSNWPVKDKSQVSYH